jgi:hypothetical protein
MTMIPPFRLGRPIDDALTDILVNVRDNCARNGIVPTSEILGDRPRYFTWNGYSELGRVLLHPIAYPKIFRMFWYRFLFGKPSYPSPQWSKGTTSSSVLTALARDKT